MNISLSVIVGWILAILGLLIVLAVFIPSMGIAAPLPTIWELALGILLIVIGVVIARGGLPHATG